MPAKATPQLGMDEIVIDSPETEEALETRWKRANSLAALRKQFEEADETAKGLVLPLLPDDAEAIRIGRFRITKSVSKPRSVSFDSAGGKVTVRIAADDDE